MHIAPYDNGNNPIVDAENSTVPHSSGPMQLCQERLRSTAEQACIRDN